MLARILRIKGCVASALLNFEKTDIEFTSKDFELMRKVTMALTAKLKINLSLVFDIYSGQFFIKLQPVNTEGIVIFVGYPYP